jgi:hypothetical protein
MGMVNKWVKMQFSVVPNKRKWEELFIGPSNSSIIETKRLCLNHGLHLWAGFEAFVVV